MKTTSKIFATLVILLVAGYSYGQTFDKLADTPHDFSAQTWTTEVCNVCHTPHNSIVSTDAPLWNHALTEQTFTLYVGTSMDATLNQPSGISKLCLSCHDGSVALDDFGGGGTPTALAGGEPLISTGLVGTDLSNDHPISFIYNNTLASTDGELHEVSGGTAPTTALGGTIENDLLFGATVGSKTVECASCHDVHGGVTGTKLLVMSNTNSQLCMTCHNK